MEEMNIKKQPKKYGKFEYFEIESAADAIIRAEEIKADPEKMKYVKECLKKRGEATEKAVSSIDEIRQARQEMDDESYEDDAE
jgi:hypothetical protein